MNRVRSLLTTLLGLAALAVLALVIVWLYKAQGALPASSAGAVASAPEATPTLPGPPQAPPVVDTVAEAPPPTASPLPSQAESPLDTPTAIPSVAPTAGAGERFVIEGYGDFPRMAVIAPLGDRGGLALYLVEGPAAVRVAEMPDLNSGSTRVTSVVSPSGVQLAACFRSSSEAAHRVDVFDLETGKRRTIAEAPGAMYPDGTQGGWTRESLESVTWWDEDHIVYTKVRWAEQAGVYEGEAWLVTTDGSEQRLLAEGPFYRVLGVSDDRERLYVTRLVPGQVDWRMEGFAVVDLASGEARPIWPAESSPRYGYDGFRVVPRPGGGLAVSFVVRDHLVGPSTEPPSIWLGDPETGDARPVVTAAGGDVRRGSAGYYAPFGVTFGPEPSEEIAYMNGGREGSPVTLWVASLETGASRRLATVDASVDWITMSPLVWVGGQIVVRDRTAFSLYSQSGDLSGEIDLARGDGSTVRRSAADALVELPVPYVHQVYDAPQWFDGGWSCGPTSMVMVLAYFGRLARNTIWVDHGVGNHATDFGYYIAETYSHKEACTGVTHSFSEAAPADGDGEGRGAHGQCVGGDGNGVLALMWRYANKHDVGHYYQYGDAGQDRATRSLLSGSPVVVLQPGHFVVLRGFYYSNGDAVYLVNDPNLGQIESTWNELDVQAWAAFHGPAVYPNLTRNGNGYGSVLAFSRSDLSSSATELNVKVCFLNDGGSLISSTQLTSATGSLVTISVDSFGALPTRFTAMARAYNPSGSDGNSVGFSSVTSHYARRWRTQNDALLTTESDAYEGISTIYDGSMSGRGVGETLYVPSALTSYWGWYSSVYLMNAGGQATVATIAAYDANGALVSSSPYALQPYQRIRWQAPAGNPTWQGSARISSSSRQPLAGTVVHEYGGGAYQTWSMSQEYPLPVNGHWNAVMPSLLRDYYGWTSAIVARSTGSSATGSAYFYDTQQSWPLALANGADSLELYLGSIPTSVVPAGFHGSGRMHMSSAFAAANQHSVTTGYIGGVWRGGTAMGMRAATGGSHEIAVPYINTSALNASLTIQNASLSTTGVTAIFRNPQGNQVGGPYTANVEPFHSLELLPGSGLPVGFSGTVQVYASTDVGRLAVSVQQSTNNDNGYGYSLP